MKILMCIFKIYDYGGIINHAEHLIYGLHQLGHDVNLVRVEDKEVCRKANIRREATDMGWSGIFYDQRYGWHFKTQNRIAFREVDWKKFTKDYDLVLWEIPVPSFKSSGFETNWKKLYDIKTPQIAFIHDGNMPKMYPHIQEVADKFEYLACVHHCALGTAKSMGLDGKLVLNPQVINLERRIISPRTIRRNTIISLQTFKRWKRVDEFIRAIPSIDKKYKCKVAGCGIEYYYMTSRDRRKPEYGDIWERALNAGMEYLGFIPEEERDRILEHSKFLVDASWSKKYNKYGSHFNRVMIDGFIKGVRPVLNQYAMMNNGFFEPGKHYLEIPFNACPMSMAGRINSDKVKPADIIDAQRIVEKNFKAEVVARELLS